MQREGISGRDDEIVRAVRINFRRPPARLVQPGCSARSAHGVEHQRVDHREAPLDIPVGPEGAHDADHLFTSSSGEDATKHEGARCTR